MESFKELFEMVKEYTRQYVIDSKELSEIAYQVWIKSLEPVSFDGNTAVLYIKAEFMKKIVEEKYLGLLTKAFEAVVGFPVKVEILCETSSNPEKKELSPASVQTSAPSAVLPSYSQEEIDMNSQGGEYEYTFATFIVGTSNKFAHAASRGGAPIPPAPTTRCLSTAVPGWEKPTCCTPSASEIKESRPKTNVIYVKGEEFTNELIDAIGNETTQDFHDKYRQADVLLVDDIQFIGGKESTQEEFFHTFDALYQDNKQIVLTSDRPPKEIKTLEERLRTRFEWGLLADIQPPDFETRIAIIRRKAELLDLEIPSDRRGVHRQPAQKQYPAAGRGGQKAQGLQLLAQTPPSILHRPERHPRHPQRQPADSGHRRTDHLARWAAPSGSPRRISAPPSAPPRSPTPGRSPCTSSGRSPRCPWLPSATSLAAATTPPSSTPSSQVVKT